MPHTGPSTLARTIMTGIAGVAAVLLVACATGPETSSIQFVAGANQTDTAVAALARTLQVRVVGAPESTNVEFESISPPRGDGTFISDIDDELFLPILSRRTDRHGEVSVRIRLGTATGDNFVRVRVPALQLVDSARFTIRAASVYTLSAAPADTALLVNEEYSVRVVVMDQHGNPREGEPVQLSNGDGTVSVAGLRARGVSIGNSTVELKSGPATGTVEVSVVPDLALTTMSILGVNVVRPNGKTIYSIPRSLPGSSAPRVSWSRDGQFMVWDATGALYRLDRTGALRQLTSGAEAAVQPAVSADGQWVYYALQRNASWHLRRIRSDGTADEAVLETSQALNWPAPSPDGRSLAYVAGEALWLLDLTDGSRRMLAAGATSPVWAPDGGEIAFLGLGLRAIRPDGTSLRFLATTDWDPGIDWSPDGAWIIGGGYTGIRVFELQTGRLIRLPYPMHWFVPHARP